MSQRAALGGRRVDRGSDPLEHPPSHVVVQRVRDGLVTAGDANSAPALHDVEPDGRVLANDRECCIGEDIRAFEDGEVDHSVLEQELDRKAPHSVEVFATTVKTHDDLSSLVAVLRLNIVRLIGVPSGDAVLERQLGQFDRAIHEFSSTS